MGKFLGFVGQLFLFFGFLCLGGLVLNKAFSRLQADSLNLQLPLTLFFLFVGFILFMAAKRIKK